MYVTYVFCNTKAILYTVANNVDILAYLQNVLQPAIAF